LGLNREQSQVFISNSLRMIDMQAEKLRETEKEEAEVGNSG